MFIFEIDTFVKTLAVLRILFLFCLPLALTAQNNIPVKDSIALKAKQPDKEVTISDYLIINQARDTTHIDTTLTMAKYYKLNSQRQDNFAYVPLNNSGQALNPLSLESWRKSTAPASGFRAKESQRFMSEELAYYHVPTPLTELYYKSTQSQGQSTDALITANIHPRFNYSIGYRGHRSLGRYQHQITGLSQLRFTSRYENPNGRYRLRLQIVNQKIEQQENGGLDSKSIIDFESGDDEFYDRDRLSVLYENASNNYTGKRYLVEQDYLIVRSTDSIQELRVRLGYRIQSTSQDHRFRQAQAYEGYGALVDDSVIPYDRLHYSLQQFDVYSILTNPTIGWLTAYARHHKYSYTHKHITAAIPKIKEDAYSIGGTWRKNFGALQLRAETELAVSGSRVGDYLMGSLTLPIKNGLEFVGGIRLQQQHPGFLFERFASSYADYTWTTNPELETRTAIFGRLSHATYGTLSFTATTIDNHAYFSQPQADSLLVTPVKSSESINLLQLEWEGRFQWGIFGFDAKLRAQQLSGNTAAMPMPDFIGRTALYYQDHWFKKAMFLQTGVSAHYYSAFNMRAYHPLLSEFVVQSHQESEGYPMVNAFFNAKVRQTRLFFVVEHVNANRKAPTYYAAPGYPQRDLLIRFGIVWNFFR